MLRHTWHQTARHGGRRMQSTKSNPFEAYAAQLKSNKTTDKPESKNDQDPKSKAELNKAVMKGLFSGIGNEQPVFKTNRAKNNNRDNKPFGGTGTFKAKGNETIDVSSDFLRRGNDRSFGDTNQRFKNSGSGFRGTLQSLDFSKSLNNKNMGRPQNKYQQNIPVQSKSSKRRGQGGPVIPKWEYGTDLEKDYMNDMIKTIYGTNTEGNIQFISETGEIEDATILKYFDIVPEGKVMGIVNIKENENTNTKLALIKYFDRYTKLKAFSDERAKGLTEQFGRTRESKRKQAGLKHVKVTWEISQSDLDNQKTNEIVNQLKKGYKLEIVIGDKHSMDRYKFDEEIAEREKADVDEEEHKYQNEKPLNSMEERRRTRVLDQIKVILSEHATIDIRGNILKRIFIMATPIAKENNTKEEAKTLKEQKKLERQEKLNKRLEKKKNKELEKKAVLENLKKYED